MGKLRDFPQWHFCVDVFSVPVNKSASMRYNVADIARSVHFLAIPVDAFLTRITRQGLNPIQAFLSGNKSNSKLIKINQFNFNSISIHKLICLQSLNWDNRKSTDYLLLPGKKLQQIVTRS